MISSPSVTGSVSHSFYEIDPISEKDIVEWMGGYYTLRDGIANRIEPLESVLSDIQMSKKRSIEDAV